MHWDLDNLEWKHRITAMLEYKKPTIFISVLSFLAGVVLALGFMTNPKGEKFEIVEDALKGNKTDVTDLNNNEQQLLFEHTSYIQNDDGFCFEPVFMSGTVTSDTSFWGKIVWLQPEGEVAIQALTYANIPGVSSESACMEHAYTSFQAKSNQIDSNDEKIKELGITYTLSHVEFIYHVYHKQIQSHKQGEGGAVWLKGIEIQK